MQVVGFSSVVQRHVDVLVLNANLDLDLDAVAVKNANKDDSPSNKNFHKAPFESVPKAFQCVGKWKLGFTFLKNVICRCHRKNWVVGASSASTLLQLSYMRKGSSTTMIV